MDEIGAGDVSITSGIGRLLPKGFPIGRVASVEKNGTAYGQILVTPAVDFTSLEQVVVVLTPTPAHEAGDTAMPGYKAAQGGKT